MNFFETIQDRTPSGGNYIKPGINERLVFNGFSVKVDKNGKGMLVRTFYPEGGDPEKTSRSQYQNFQEGVRNRKAGNGTEDVSRYVEFCESLFHFTDTMIKRKDAIDIMMRTMPVATSAIDDLVPSIEQLENFCAAINQLTVGKVVRYKFVGEEKESTKEAGKIIQVPSLRVAYVPYAEAVEEGAEKPVVDKENTKLRFNPESKYDLVKMIPVAPDLDSSSFGATNDNPGF